MEGALSGETNRASAWIFFDPELLTRTRCSCHMRYMAVGQSGRIVVDMDPSLKRALHARLAGDGKHLKQWLLEQIEHYLAQGAESADRLAPLVSAAPRWKEPPMLRAAEQITRPYAKRRMP